MFQLSVPNDVTESENVDEVDVELVPDKAVENQENVPAKKCGICGHLHYYRECAYALINNKIPDTPVVSKAVQSLPDVLKITKMADETSAVFAKFLVEAGAEFGPLVAKKSLTLHPETQFSIKVFNDGEPDLAEFYLDCTNEHECCWMMFVQPADHVGEQNLICYQEQDDIYFGAIKDIEPGEELKVWYSPYYASKMQKHLLTFKDTTNLQISKPVADLEGKDLDILVNEQQKIVPRAVWNCKFCYKLEKKVTLFAKHLIGHYCMKQKRKCELCSVSFSYKLDYDKHVKYHKRSKLVNEPLPVQCPDSMDNSNFLLPQVELNIVNLENLDNNLLLDDNLLLNLDMVRTEDAPNNNKAAELVCDICLKKFKRKRLLVEHLKMHIGVFHCASCNRVFSRKETLDHHQCNRSYSHKCPKCPRLFSQRKRLNHHLKANHDSKYSCRHCHRQYFDHQNHICAKDPNSISKCPRKRHDSHGSVRYVCAKCSKIYASKDIYERHLRTVHSNDKRFACQVCDRKFARRDNLNTHLLEMHLWKPMQETFKCKFCEKGFVSKRILDSHLKSIHTLRKEATFSCKDCQISFNYSRNLLRHIKLVHDKKNSGSDKSEKFKCTLCPREYNYFRSLQSHVKDKHPQDYINEKLKSNNNDRSVHCPECWQKFPSHKMMRLQRHVWHKHPQRYDSFCQEFNLENQTMFRCPLCPKEFIVNDSLQRHLKTHNTSELETIIPKEPSPVVKKPIKPFKTNEPNAEACPICGHKLKLKSSLLRHMKQKHPQENANGPWTDVNGVNFTEKTAEKETNFTDEEEFDNYMDLQKTIENMDFNVDMVDDNQLSCNEFIDKFLKESSDQISLFLADSPKPPTPTVNVSEASTSVANIDQSNRRDIVSLSMLDFPDLDFSEIELEPLGPLSGRIATPTMANINDVPDVVLYVRNDK